MDTRTIDTLNGLLRDELAAIATYEEALRGRSAFSGKTELSRCQRSHEKRATVLHSKIASMGGRPATSSGMRGAWEKIVEAGAMAIGDEIAIRALEAGEVRVLRDYQKGIATLDGDATSFVLRDLFPEEVFTFQMMKDLVRMRSS